MTALPLLLANAVTYPGLAWELHSVFADVAGLICCTRAYIMRKSYLWSIQVGNAVTEGREIVVGTGSVTLITAAMYGFAGGNWEGNITEGVKLGAFVCYFL